MTISVFRPLAAIVLMTAMTTATCQFSPVEEHIDDFEGDRFYWTSSLEIDIVRNEASKILIGCGPGYSQIWRIFVYEKQFDADRVFVQFKLDDGDPERVGGFTGLVFDDGDIYGVERWFDPDGPGRTVFKAATWRIAWASTLAIRLYDTNGWPVTIRHSTEGLRSAFETLSKKCDL